MSNAQNILSKIYQKISYAKNDAGNLWGRNLRLFREARGARIVVYHGICRKDHTRYNNIFLTREIFEEHLRYYRKYFHVISLDDYYQQRFRKDRFNICISFDDGYANNFKYVLPLLEKYKIPAAFFVTGIRDAGYDILWNDFLGIVNRHGPENLRYKGDDFRKNRFSQYISRTDNISLVNKLRSGNFDVKAEMMELLYPLVPFRNDNKVNTDYWLQMTEEEIRQMARSPWVTLGAHGYYHNDLALLDAAESGREMERSKRYLEDLTGKEIRSIAFPYGAYTRESVAAGKKAGYSQLLALDFFFAEDHSDPALRERFIVNPFISATNQMIATIKRTYVF